MEFLTIVSKASEYEKLARTLNESEKWIEELVNISAANALANLAKDCAINQDEGLKLQQNIATLDKRQSELLTLIEEEIEARENKISKLEAQLSNTFEDPLKGGHEEGFDENPEDRRAHV